MPQDASITTTAQTSLLHMRASLQIEPYSFTAPVIELT
jgi:hypothetical protein